MKHGERARNAKSEHFCACAESDCDTNELFWLSSEWSFRRIRIRTRTWLWRRLVGRIFMCLFRVIFFFCFLCGWEHYSSWHANLWCVPKQLLLCFQLLLDLCVLSDSKWFAGGLRVVALLAICGYSHSHSQTRTRTRILIISWLSSGQTRAAYLNAILSTQ